MKSKLRFHGYLCDNRNLKNPRIDPLKKGGGLKIQRWVNSWDRAALAICFGIILMAFAVLVGWHAQIRTAVQIFLGLVPMQYNTALSFLALGAAGIGLVTGRRLLLLGGGSFTTVMGAAVILEYATGTSPGSIPYSSTHGSGPCLLTPGGWR